MKKVVRASAGLAALAATAAAVAATVAATALVTNGSPQQGFSQNKQNEPAVAIDPTNAMNVAAGANEEIDMELCQAGDPTTCPFTPGVGSSGFYRSTSGGASWTQPTYTGFSARTCTGPAACTPVEHGQIGTLPNYDAAGLVSDGDPALAFGPKPDGHGGFTYDNGARLYYGNLTANKSESRKETTFSGFEDIAVSHTDDLGTTWSSPALVGKQNAALFNDKDAVWADNTQSSPFFGRVYMCNASFRGQEIVNGFPEPILFYRSLDGGDMWSNPQQLSRATDNTQTGGRQDCAVRTDSKGTIYVYWDATDHATGLGTIIQDRSSDGGKTFEKPRTVATFTGCGIFDPPNGALSFDGADGARTSSEPSVDIANNAPAGGSSASNEIVITYCDGATPTSTSQPNEAAALSYSTDGGNTFTKVSNVADSSDRPDFPAVAISPNGNDVWLVYDAFHAPWQATTTSPRPMEGVVRHASVTAGVPGSFSTVLRGPQGDARGSSANALTTEFLGDYNYIAASNSRAVAVWNDVRNAADCPAVDAFRAGTGPQPAVNDPTVCPPGTSPNGPTYFGNSDIWSASLTP
jgi:hypothetical protein